MTHPAVNVRGSRVASWQVQMWDNIGFTGMAVQDIIHIQPSSIRIYQRSSQIALEK
jgi:hypothetical protein